jgi:hypothetical protein
MWLTQSRVCDVEILRTSKETASYLERDSQREHMANREMIQIQLPDTRKPSIKLRHSAFSLGLEHLDVNLTGTQRFEVI